MLGGTRGGRTGCAGFPFGTGSSKSVSLPHAIHGSNAVSSATTDSKASPSYLSK